MDRRRFLGSAAGLAALATAGCLGGNNQPPPRQTKVFQDVSIANQSIQISLVSSPEVQSDAEASQQAAVPLALGRLGSLSPVGVARAAKGATGRGSRSSYSSAPKHSRHRAWAVWHGSDDDDEWREEHQDELQWHEATVAALGVGYLGVTDEYEDNPPGPGYVPQDKQWTEVEDGAMKQVNLSSVTDEFESTQGWYRVGTKLEADDGSIDFGWQGADIHVVDTGSGLEVERGWYVKPRV